MVLANRSRTVAAAVGFALFVAWPHALFTFPVVLGSPSGFGTGRVLSVALMGICAALTGIALIEARGRAVVRCPAVRFGGIGLFCGGVALVLFSDTVGGLASEVLGIGGSLALGLGSALVDVAWGFVFARFSQDAAEFLIALSVFGGIGTAVALVCLPQPYAAVGMFLGTVGSCVLLAILSGVLDEETSMGNTQSTSRRLLWQEPLFILVFCLIWALADGVCVAFKMNIRGLWVPVLVGSAAMVLVLVLLYYRFSSRVRFSAVMGAASVGLAAGAYGVVTAASTATLTLGYALLMAASFAEYTAVRVRATALIRGSSAGESPAMAIYSLAHYAGTGGARIACTTFLLALADALPLLFLLTVVLLAAVVGLLLGTPDRVLLSNCRSSGDTVATGEKPSEAELWEAVCQRVSDAHGLTQREGEVLALLARGRDTAFIRDELGISQHTVGTHVKHIYQKLGVHSKQELIDCVSASL